MSENAEIDDAVVVDKVTLVFSDANGDPVLAVDDVSLNVPRGQFLAIVGPSGCGKTTILNMLSGLIHPTLGDVIKNGEVVKGPSMDVGYMLARSALFPWRTARRNVEMPMEIRGVPKAERRRRADELLEMVKLGDFKNKYPSNCRRACGNELLSRERSPSSRSCGYLTNPSVRWMLKLESPCRTNSFVSGKTLDRPSFS